MNIWTTMKPTVEGWYWCKCKGALSGRTYTTMVKVNPLTSLVFWDGENFDINSDSFTAWGAVPIEEPNGEPVQYINIVGSLKLAHEIMKEVEPYIEKVVEDTFPGHTCGPQSPCDSDCVDHAHASALLTRIKLFFNPKGKKCST